MVTRKTSVDDTSLRFKGVAKISLCGRNYDTVWAVGDSGIDSR